LYLAPKIKEMKYNILKITVLLSVFIGLFSCRKDDSTSEIPVKPLSEQAPIDDDSLVSFLSTHYYNEEAFTNAGSIPNFNYDIRFTDVASTDGLDIDGDDVGDINIGTPYTRTKLIDLVETKIITVSGVDHKLYLLKVRDDDALPTPKFCDSTFLAYKGMDLQLNQFDGQVNPIWLDLSKTVKGFSESVSELNAATSFTDNGDGTFTYNNFGIGAVFMPSGLGYYATPPLGISFYSPLIFTYKVMGFNTTDHDKDHVPTYLEDLNGDHNLSNDNTDGDNSPNFPFK